MPCTTIYTCINLTGLVLYINLTKYDRVQCAGENETFVIIFHVNNIQYMNVISNIITICRYSKVLEQKEELEQKHLHLLQILDSERQAKWHYVQQTEELATSVKELRAEVGCKKAEVGSQGPWAQNDIKGLRRAQGAGLRMIPKG